MTDNAFRNNTPVSSNPITWTIIGSKVVGRKYENGKIYRTEISDEVSIGWIVYLGGTRNDYKRYNFKN